MLPVKDAMANSFARSLVSGLTFAAPITDASAASKVVSIDQQQDLEAKKEEIASQIQYFDESGNEIFPYTLDELKEMIVLDPVQPTLSLAQESDMVSIAADYRVFTQTPFSFKSNYWLGGGLWGKAFKDPSQLFITPTGTAKAMIVIARKDVNNNNAGDEAGRVSLPGGWTGEIYMSWSHLTRGKSYRFNFMNNAGDVEHKISKAVLWYD